MRTASGIDMTRQQVANFCGYVHGIKAYIKKTALDNTRTYHGNPKKHHINVAIHSIHTLSCVCAYIYIYMPSRKHTKNDGKSPFLIGKFTISMAIFKRYVSSARLMFLADVFEGPRSAGFGRSVMLLVIIIYMFGI